MMRMDWVVGLLALAASQVAGAQGRTLDPAQPNDAIEIMRKLQCGAGDGVPAIYRWSGHVYSRVEGERDRRLFDVEGMNVRQCVALNDPKRGKGYRQVSRELMVYLDPATGEIVRNWKNPWTGETVELFHVANDPVNSRPTYAYGEDGKPYKLKMVRMGDWLMMPLEVPLFYKNPLAGEYQDFVGNHYHAMEIFDFVMPAKEALNPRSREINGTVSWVRLSDWLPWMKMGGRAGGMVHNAVGTKVKSFDELPKVLKDEIALNYPTYNTPPPLDDQRPNATSWTEFKKKLDAQKK
jgi:hypothetical protein